MTTCPPAGLLPDLDDLCHPSAWPSFGINRPPTQSARQRADTSLAPSGTTRSRSALGHTVHAHPSCKNRCYPSHRRARGIQAMGDSRDRGQIESCPPAHMLEHPTRSGHDQLQALGNQSTPRSGTPGQRCQGLDSSREHEVDQRRRLLEQGLPIHHRVSGGTQS